VATESERNNSFTGAARNSSPQNLKHNCGLTASQTWLVIVFNVFCFTVLVRNHLTLILVRKKLLKWKPFGIVLLVCENTEALKTISICIRRATKAPANGFPLRTSWAVTGVTPPQRPWNLGPTRIQGHSISFLRWQNRRKALIQTTRSHVCCPQERVAGP
jgi:hypothetical protein